IFGIEPNIPVMHQALQRQLANRRAGTHNTLTRGEVRGGGRKPWRQKGTGRARQGSIRAPHWRGGGVVFGPHPRSYRQDIPKKVKALARRSAFNQRALNEEITVIASLAMEAPKTKRVAELLGKMGVAGAKRVLVLTNGSQETVYRSVRNIPNVEVMPFAQASAYDVLRARQLVIEASALDAVRSSTEEVAHA
ncbi:MAG TPA: 50S ribosomal protein L4, partial [Longimicrobium sp.]